MHQFADIDVNIIENKTSMTVIVTNMVRKSSGAETAKANETAPLIPHTHINIVSGMFHDTPPILATKVNKETFNIRPTSVASMALKPCPQYINDDCVTTPPIVMYTYVSEKSAKY